RWTERSRASLRRPDRVPPRVPRTPPVALFRPPTRGSGKRRPVPVFGNKATGGVRGSGGLKERVDERCGGAAGKQEHQAEQKQKNRQQPPFLAVPQERPVLGKQAATLAGRLFQLAGMLCVHFLPPRSELTEITAHLRGRRLQHPVAVAGWPGAPSEGIAAAEP